MSDNIPLEIQVEIIKRLPVKLLVQYRSVSKTWKSLIDSPKFIVSYGVSGTQPHRLLVTYKDRVDADEENYVLIDEENNTYAQQEFTPSVPVFKKLLKSSQVFGSSHGLLCAFGHYRDFGYSSRILMVVICNPSIRKLIGIALPGMLDLPFGNTVGFGVCPVTSDPTIVKITYDGNNGIPWQVQIFKLSTGTWGNLSVNLPCKTIRVTWCQQVIDRFIYWLAHDIQIGNLIISFDMITQEFKMVHLPQILRSNLNLDLSKVWGTLAVLDYDICNDMYADACVVWTMEDSVTKSFRKLFTVSTPYAWFKIVGFEKNGKSIMETLDDFDEPVTLQANDPSSESEYIIDFGINGKRNSFNLSSYMETLLLLDQSNYRVYFNNN